MARLESEYFDLKYKFEKEMAVMTDKFVTQFSVINSGKSDTELQDDIYRFLSKNTYDDKSYQFVYESVKLDNPSLTYKSFIKDYAYRDKGNINNINNKSISEKLFSSVKTNISPLEDRVNRLANYAVDITQSSVKESMDSVGNILKTNITIEKDIEKKIKNIKWQQKSTGITKEQKKSLDQDIAALNDQLKTTKNANKMLNKKYNSFASSYDTMTDYTLDKEYKKLLSTVSDTITNDIQKVVLQQSMNNSATYSAKQFAQTSFVDTVTQNDLAQFEADGVSYVKWTLSSTHVVTGCSCDKHANKNSGKGKGVYALAKAPHPITDSHPNCRCTLREV